MDIRGPDALVTAIVGLASGLTSAITTIRVIAARSHRRDDDLPPELRQQFEAMKSEFRQKIDDLEDKMGNRELPREFWEKFGELKHMLDTVATDTRSIRTRLHDLANTTHEMVATLAKERD